VNLESDILRRHRTVAVVGASSSEDRESYGVARYLKAHGYRIIPVNPNETEVLGEESYPDLLSVSEPVEIVLVFRKSENVPRIVEEAIAVGAKVVWMQTGIRNEAAAERARSAGLEVVMDRCMRTEHRKLAMIGGVE
jgi:predicted CoA-binding protein